MAMIYASVATHPMLSEEAKALATSNPQRFDSHQLLAETLLRLGVPAYTAEADIDRIRLALAVQINFQLAQGVDPFVLESISSSHTRQSKVFRDRLLSPQAAELVAAVDSQYVTSSSGGWLNMRSFRSSRDSATPRWYTGGFDVRSNQ